MTLTEALEEFLLEKKLAGLAKTSLNDYENMISILISHIGNIPIESLTYTQINGYILHLLMGICPDPPLPLT